MREPKSRLGDGKRLDSQSPGRANRWLLVLVLGVISIAGVALSVSRRSLARQYSERLPTW